MEICHWENVTRLQKRATRAITCSKFDSHTEPLLKLLKLLKINDIYVLNNLTFYYKYIHKMLPPFFGTFEITFSSHIHAYNTRQKDIFYTAYKPQIC